LLKGGFARRYAVVTPLNEDGDPNFSRPMAPKRCQRTHDLDTPGCARTGMPVFAYRLAAVRSIHQYESTYLRKLHRVALLPIKIFPAQILEHRRGTPRPGRGLDDATD